MVSVGNIPIEIQRSAALALLKENLTEYFRLLKEASSLNIVEDLVTVARVEKIGHVHRQEADYYSSFEEIGEKPFRIFINFNGVKQHGDPLYASEVIQSNHKRHLQKLAEYAR